MVHMHARVGCKRSTESAKTFNLNLSTPHYDFFSPEKKKDNIAKRRKRRKGCQVLIHLAVVPGIFLV